MSSCKFNKSLITLEKIHTFLEKEGIQLSESETQTLNSIFITECDEYDNKNHKKGSDGFLNDLELIKFMNIITKKLNPLKEIFTKMLKNIDAEIGTENIKSTRKSDKSKLVETDTKNGNKSVIAEKVKSIIKKEIKKHHTESNGVDIEYWSDIISKTSEEYNIPYEIIVSIISRETNGKFTKNENCSGGAGPMQLTEIAVKSFYPNAKGNWHDIFINLDKKLLDDVLYKKNKDGSFKTDKSGNKILAYSSAIELRNACAANNEFGVKTGILYFKMKYAEAIAIELYGKGSYSNVKKVIDGLQNGTIQLTEAQKKKCLTLAFVNYNGETAKKEKYGRDVMDSLKIHHFDFKNFEIIK